MSDKVSQMNIDATMAPETMGSSMPPDSLGWIDDYALVRELGGGGFGSVYLVRDPKTKVEYAVKGLPAIVRQNKEELENVLANFRLVQGLEGHHIAHMRFVHYPKTVNYFYKEDREKLRVEAGDPLIVMSYAPGMTLSKWRKMQPGGLVPHEKAVEIVRQIADALDYAHHANPPIIHRDVKPSNVMIEDRPDGSFDCRVLDFGLAAEIRTTMGRISMEIRDVCGTRPYMAPEQWVGDRQDAETDQYALAVLYCELVTGKVPFQSAFDTGDVEIMKSAVLTRRPDLSEVPRVARKAVARALAKKLNGRYPTCTAFAEALKGASRALLPWAAVGSGVLAVSAAALVAWPRLSQPRREKGSLPNPDQTIETVPLPNVPYINRNDDATNAFATIGSESVPQPEPDVSKPTPRPKPPPHSHVCGEWRTIRKPSCVVSGLAVRVCTASGCTLPAAAETNSLPALGHLPGDWITNAVSTCENSGQQMRCCLRENCGKQLLAEPLPKLGHDWGQWETNRPPQIGAAGLLQHVCRQCRLRETKPIAALPAPNADHLDGFFKVTGAVGKERQKAISRIWIGKLKYDRALLQRGEYAVEANYRECNRSLTIVGDGSVGVILTGVENTLPKVVSGGNVVISNCLVRRIGVQGTGKLTLRNCQIGDDSAKMALCAGTSVERFDELNFVKRGFSAVGSLFSGSRRVSTGGASVRLEHCKLCGKADIGGAGTLLTWVGERPGSNLFTTDGSARIVFEGEEASQAPIERMKND